MNDHGERELTSWDVGVEHPVVRTYQDQPPMKRIRCALGIKSIAKLLRRMTSTMLTALKTGLI